jgi:hypothetical protein
VFKTALGRAVDITVTSRKSGSFIVSVAAPASLLSASVIEKLMISLQGVLVSNTIPTVTVAEEIKTLGLTIFEDYLTEKPDESMIAALSDALEKTTIEELADLDSYSKIIEFIKKYLLSK